MYLSLIHILTKDLTVEELGAFTEQIARQYETGWGEQLKFHDIKTRNGDVISIRLYHDGLAFFTGAAFEKQICRARIRQPAQNRPER